MRNGSINFVANNSKPEDMTKSHGSNITNISSAPKTTGQLIGHASQEIAQILHFEQVIIPFGARSTLIVHICHTWYGLIQMFHVRRRWMHQFWASPVAHLLQQSSTLLSQFVLKWVPMSPVSQTHTIFHCAGAKIYIEVSLAYLFAIH